MEDDLLFDLECDQPDRRRSASGERQEYCTNSPKNCAVQSIRPPTLLSYQDLQS